MSKTPGKLERSLEYADGVTTIVGLLFAFAIASVFAGALAWAVYPLFLNVNSMLATIAGVMTFFLGIPIGLLVYKFRWFLRGLFD